MNRRKFLLGAAAGLGLTGATAASASWSSRDVPPPSGEPDPSTWPDNAITLAWLGHATVLINFYGVRVLTDPALFPRVGVDAWLTTIGPLRLASCALTPGQLPDIDLVVISHAHFDHLDTPSLAAVPGRPAAAVASRLSDLVPRRRYSSVRELRWGDSTRVDTPRGDIEVRAIEVKHWGTRLRHDNYRGYNGYIIRREGRALLFGGDTAQTPLFRSYRGFGPLEAAIMPVGAYDPYIRNHCTPEQAVEMADAAGARLFIPIHHKTFQLSREPVNEPIERTQKALSSELDRLALKEIGETARIA